MATVIKKSALLFFSAEQMYDLVNDVAAYPQVVDHVVGAEIIDLSPEMMTAKLSFAKSGVEMSFTTQNNLERPVSIALNLVDGPFTAFTGRWQFTHLREGACKVSLYIEFVTDSALTSKLASGLFESISHSLVDAFYERAKLIYGAE